VALLRNTLYKARSRKTDHKILIRVTNNDTGSKYSAADVVMAKVYAEMVNKPFPESIKFERFEVFIAKILEHCS